MKKGKKVLREERGRRKEGKKGRKSKRLGGSQDKAGKGEGKGGWGVRPRGVDHKVNTQRRFEDGYSPTRIPSELRGV